MSTRQEIMEASTAAAPAEQTGYTSLFISAPDGLRLHVRSYGRRTASTLPVVCLHGLARTAADFHALAVALASDPAEPRWVLSLDLRGRGESEYDRNPDNYALPVELADVSAVLTALEIAPAVFVGTSRGGLIAMMLAAARPTVIAGVALNDIGPVIEPKGLMRIKSYVGKLPTPRDYEEGADILRRLFAAQFPRLEPADWLAFAHRTWKERKGQLVPDYDVKLADTLAGADFERPLPPLWHQFDALARVPVMVIHGANSDILSAATVAAMRSRRYDIDVIEVPDQGHAPLLAERDLIHRIASFIVFCEISARRH
jgi:pimeloyl-ACP methyl ester carboxylesterase